MAGIGRFGLELSEFGTNEGMKDGHCGAGILPASAQRGRTAGVSPASARGRLDGRVLVAPSIRWSLNRIVRMLIDGGNIAAC